MRFSFDKKKNELLRNNPKRGIGFEEAIEIWSYLYYEDYRSDDPEQFRVIGWVGGKLYSPIYEIREDEEGEYIHLVTLWKPTPQEEKLYEENR